MSDEADDLSFEISADATPLTSGMTAAEASLNKVLATANQLSQAIDAMAGEMAKSREAAEGAAQAHNESAGAIGLAVEGYHMAAEAAAALAEGLVHLGEASLDAAAQLDPASANLLAGAHDHLHDSVLNLEAAIGRQLAPAVAGLENKLGDVAAKLSHMDWASYAQQAEPFFSQVLAGAESWGAKLLDILTWPFRMMVGETERQMAAVLGLMGDMMNKAGSTWVGKKVGLNEYSGDALKDTGADMSKQADAFEKSFADAAKQVGDGIKFTWGAAVDYVNQKTGGLVDRMSKDYGKASTDSGAGHTELEVAARIKIENEQRQFEAWLTQQQNARDQAHLALTRQTAAAQRAEDQAAAQQADQKLQQAMKQLEQDRSQGNLGSLAKDQQAVQDALTASQQAYQKVITDNQAVLDDANQKAKDLTAQYNAQLDVVKKAEAAMQAAQAAAARTPQLESAKEAQAKAEQDLAIAQQQASQLGGMMDAAVRTAATQQVAVTRETEQMKTKGEHDRAAIQMDAAKASSEFLSSTLRGLAKGALGGVGGGALDAGIKGFAAGGPMGAAVGVGTSLLQSSAGFKKVSDALNTLFQTLADTIGKVVEPLVPVIQRVGQALQPLFDVLGQIMTLVGQLLSDQLMAAITPIVQLIKPVADLLTALSPLLDSIAKVAAIVMQVAVLFDPLFWAMEALSLAIEILSPAIKAVSDVIHAIVEALGSVWNGFIGIVADVLDFLAHALPGSLGDAARSFQQQVLSMEFPLDSVAQAAAAAAEALGYLTTRGMTMSDIMSGARDSSNAGAQAQDQAILAAWFGSTGANGINNQAGVTTDLFNEAMQGWLTQDGGTWAAGFMDAVKTAADAVTKATGDDTNAQQKVTLDKANIEAIQQAMNMTTDPAVKAELEKELAQAQQQYQLDQDAKAVADAQLAIANAQLQLTKDQLTQQVLSAEWSQAMSMYGANSSQAAAVAQQLYGDVGMFGTVNSSNAGNAGINGQIWQDNQNANSAQTSLQNAMAQQALDQAAANTTATTANTAATNSLNTTLTNMVSGFNVTAYEYAAQGGNGGLGSSSQAIWASASQALKDMLKNGAVGRGAAGVQINGDVHVEVDSKSPDDFADRVEDALRNRQFKRTGQAAPASGHF